MLLPAHANCLYPAGGSPSTTRSLTPAEALEREMQELSCVEPATAAAAMGLTHPRPHSSTNGMACYKNPYFESTPMYSPSDRAGPGLRPASSGGSPLAAQHNNLMGPMSPRGIGSMRPGSTGSNRSSREDVLATQLGLTKLKTKL